MHTGFEREPGVDGIIAWIGAKPTRLQISALLLIGNIGMLICGVQPVLLGALLNEHRLTSVELGWGTTAEFLTLGVSISAAGAFSRTRNMRAKIAMAALAAIAADLLVTGQSGLAVIANRAVCGLAEGVLVWCTTCMITRASAPARWAGIFLTLQGITQLAFAAAAPATVMSVMGANGGFYALAGTAALALLAVPAMPDRMADLPKTEGQGEGAANAYTPAAIASLVSVFLIAAFSIGLFAYLAPLATQAQINGKGLGLIVSISLATSILGSALAAVTANRVTYFAIFVVCLLVNAITLIVLAALPGLIVFSIAAGVFGFFWLYFLPFQIPFVIESDPTRHIAVIVPGAQLLGGSAGPLLCSFFVSNADSRGALWVCGVCFLLAFAISLGLHLRHLLPARTQPAV
jgi:MFS family permease